MLCDIPDRTNVPRDAFDVEILKLDFFSITNGFNYYNNISNHSCPLLDGFVFEKHYFRSLLWNLERLRKPDGVKSLDNSR